MAWFQRSQVRKNNLWVMTKQTLQMNAANPQIEDIFKSVRAKIFYKITRYGEKKRAVSPNQMHKHNYPTLFRLASFKHMKQQTRRKR